MTKNLKLKIKNSQLTKAAGLDKLKAKLAQAGSNSETKSGDKSVSKSGARSKTSKINDSLDHTSSTPVEFSESFAPTTRRIRAKAKSSFAVEDPLPSQEENGSSVPAESAPLLKTEETPSLESSSRELSDSQEEALLDIATASKEGASLMNLEGTIEESVIEEVGASLLPEEQLAESTEQNEVLSSSSSESPNNAHSFSQDVSVKNSNDYLGEVSSNNQVLPSAKPAPGKVTIKSKFGPTGKHINHLLAKTKKPSNSEVSEKPSGHESVQRPTQPLKRADSENHQQKRLDQQHPPIPSRSSTRKDPKKALSEFKDGRRKSSDSSRPFPTRERYSINSEGDDEKWRKKRQKPLKKSVEEHSVQRPTNIKVSLPITVKDLASEMKLKASELIQKMFIHGMTYVVNDLLDDETTVQFIGSEFGCSVEIDYSEKEKIQVVSNTVTEEIAATDPSKLVTRPPVVAFMGHVDHGKTSLIDALRKSNIASGEAGAITQHMGAFRCTTPVGDITILDTPGHEAFSAMRARGAETCDIAVLVVAGDEGIKEQTVEAIKHALAAGIVIVVAINKVDKPSFNADNVYRQLSEYNLLPEAWGGTVATVNTSAKTGEGLSDLLEMLALQAEVLELKADPTNRARGAVIESELHKGLGHVATVLVQNGTLRIGDSLVFNDCYCRVKTMHDEHSQAMKEAGPSTPVLITGLSNIPKAGDPFVVVKNDKVAKEIIEARIAGKQRYALQQKRKPSFDAFLQNKKILKLIIKADVQGSVEALVGAIGKISSEKVDVEIVSTGVGEISESDIRLAAASKVTIIGFHTSIESHAEPLIKSLGIQVRLHDIIYHAIDDIKEIMVSILDPIAEEKVLGSAEIKEIFKSSQLGQIYGCLVLEGSVVRNQKANLIRGKEAIGKGTIASLKRVKEDVREVKKGLECGILLDGHSGQAKIGDIIQCYEIIYHPQTL